MSLHVQVCPVWSFEPVVRFTNELRMPAELYGIAVPRGLSAQSVPMPEFVKPQRMIELLRSHSHQRVGSGLGVVHGLTKAEFSVRFSDPLRQWRQVSPQGRPAFWHFQGGPVHLEVEIGVYVLEGNKPSENDPITGRIFAIIMEHELLHVLDEIEIIRDWMPPEAAADPMVRRYLTDANPVDDGMYSHWFLGRGFKDWLENGFWAREHNRRAAVRDSPSEYRALQERIDALRRQQVNRP